MKFWSYEQVACFHKGSIVWLAPVRECCSTNEFTLEELKTLFRKGSVVVGGGAAPLIGLHLVP